MIPPEIGVSSQPGQILEVPIKKGVMDSPFFAPKDKNGIFIAASPCKARVWSAGLAAFREKCSQLTTERLRRRL